MFSAHLLAAALAASPAIHCPDGFEPVGTDACLIAPRPFTAPGKLVVYLHGMLPGNADWAATPEFKVLGGEAKRRGYALLAVRGERGLCSWAKELRDYFCWPSDRSQQKELARTVKRIAEVVAKVQERLVAQLGAPFLAGFSNGGFFLSMLLADARPDARGYAVLHAGNVGGQPPFSERARPTILLGARADAIQLPSMRRLEQDLADAGWSPSFSLRDGNHEVTAVDSNAMFDFFDSVDSQ